MARTRLTAKTAPTPRLTLWGPALMGTVFSLLFLAVLSLVQR